jgi:hypothetical protein
VSVRPVECAAVRVTAAALPLRYDLRWYDDTESIVPLWWLGVWGPGPDELIRTEVLQGPRRTSRRQLYDWLVGVVPPAPAARLAADAADAADGGADDRSDDRSETGRLVA